MIYLKSFNEAVIDWETDNIKKFYEDCIKKYESNFKIGNEFITFEELQEIGNKNGIEVVKYDTFYRELPTDKMREDAPNKRIKLFGLVNPQTNIPRLVCGISSYEFDKRDIEFANHVLKHENIHVIQKNRSGGRFGEYLGDITDSESYFSDKNEVMAFSQSIADILLSTPLTKDKSNGIYSERLPESIEEAMSSLEKVGLWQHVKKTVNEKTLKRYKKYIYLYLELHFDKLNNE